MTRSSLLDGFDVLQFDGVVFPKHEVDQDTNDCPVFAEQRRDLIDAERGHQAQEQRDLRSTRYGRTLLPEQSQRHADFQVVAGNGRITPSGA